MSQSKFLFNILKINNTEMIDGTKQGEEAKT